MKRVDLNSIRDSFTSTKDIEIEQWGGFVSIKKLSAKERDTIALLHDEAKQNESWLDALLQTIIVAVVDDSHQPLFSSNDKQTLENQDGEIINHLYGEILTFNGMKEAQDTDQQVKP